MEELIEGAAKSAYETRNPGRKWEDATGGEAALYRGVATDAVRWIRAQPGWVVENTTEPGGSKGWSE